MMKLRLRSIDSKETVKIEVPTNCSVEQFKQNFSQLISSPPSSIHISLNRKDELSGSSPNDTLLSLGVTSGDLVFYSLNPNVFKPSETLTLANPSEIGNSGVESNPSKIGNSGVESGAVIEKRSSVQDQNMVDSEIGMSHQEETKLSDSDMGIGIPDQFEDPIREKEEFAEYNMAETEGSLDEMMEDMDTVQGSGFGERVSVPFSLKKVVGDEFGSDCFDVRLMVIAVHAVLLESGFVRVDTADLFGVLEDWLSSGLTMSLRYTLSELIGSNANDVTESVVLKFQRLGQFVKVYGSLGRNATELHELTLDGDHFVNAIYVVLNNITQDAQVSGSNGYNNKSMIDTQSELYEFWKKVKDGLMLPLLIDICDKAGLGLPPCLMRLPTELKLNILELLPGVDLAKIGCVSSELRYLSSNNDIWKQKFVEEFTSKMESGTVNWKERFAALWKSRKQRSNGVWRRGYFNVGRPIHGQLIQRNHPMFSSRRIVGGEGDVAPGGFGPLFYGEHPACILRAHPACILRAHPHITQAAGATPLSPARPEIVPKCDLHGLLYSST